MNLRRMTAILAIAKKYNPDGTGTFAAEHDILYLPIGLDVSEDDAAELRSLGAHEEREFDCWSVFT